MKWAVALLVLLTVAATAFYVASQPSGTRISPSGSSTPPTSSSAHSAQRQYIILLDVSASRPSAMIRQGEQYVYTIIDQMSYGDRILLLQMYEENVREAKEPLVLLLKQGATSLSLDPEEDLNRDRKGLKETAHIYFSRADANRAPHTDILTTLSVVSEHISHTSKNELVILSDMLQSDRVWEFEHLQRMPHANWIQERKEQGLIRPLGGACVLAVGADPSSHEGVVVRDFWQKYFTESNATLATQNYRSTAPSDGSVCE